MTRAGSLVVIDLPEVGRPASLVRRILGSGALDWTGIVGNPWLVLAPSGDGGDRAWCRGSAVIEPSSLIDRDSRRALTEDVVRISNAVIAALDPPGPGLDLGELNRGFVQRWVHDLMYRERAVHSACGALGLARCRILSGSRRRARWLAAGIRASGIEARAIGLPDRLWRLGSATRDTGRWVATEPLPQADLLLLAESAPMAGMFGAVEDALPASIRARTLRVSYGSATPRSGECAVRQAQPRWLAGAPESGGSASPNRGEVITDGWDVVKSLPQDIPVSVRYSFASLRASLLTDWLPRQEPWARHVRDVLQRVRPFVLVVGNDRFWTGQTFTRLAREQGVVTVCLQDGIGLEDPSWAFTTSEHLLASGTLWPRLLAQYRSPGGRVSVVGQPRYDGAAQRFKTLRSWPPKRHDTETARVLLVLQEIHGPDYVSAVLQEILRVERAEVLIRPHPAHDQDGFKELRQPRVHVGSGTDVVADLAWADLVVTEYSTVAVEALALGLPLLSVTLSGRPPLLDLTVPGQAEAVSEKSQIAAAVSRLLAGTSDAPDTTTRRSALLDELVGPLDGSSASRVAAIVGRLLERGEP